ncbi:uncharacterized protein SPAPADRAFT_57874 [Spathaspora passalidarum NRRL Y-27907]|uniref:Uncharacterized protein n=1 Tax=Spathaspora passalidarum (strain NRRL Y-27907 / 11-Y1) TaxID=619300 RepID=G3AEZ9_SPAPN|nr:uncharacterized protein SPAPADRAFT_57874 [Spathaspora passalidarum NRRL Y-27907]EGW34803.1 hypothetical protein SPAPADRAFT_57874 [Spathaspora passalidarum NRRL Y-27907]
MFRIAQVSRGSVQLSRRILASNGSASPVFKRYNSQSQIKHQLDNTKAYLKKVKVEDSKESEQVLAYFRKAGVVTAGGILLFYAYAITVQMLNKEDEEPEVVPVLSQDVRYR